MSNQETNQKQIQFPAQQELKHLRTRCGKVYALGNNRFRAGGADHAGSRVRRGDAPVGGTVCRKAPADGGAGAQPDCDVFGQRE